MIICNNNLNHKNEALCGCRKATKCIHMRLRFTLCLFVHEYVTPIFAHSVAFTLMQLAYV